MKRPGLGPEYDNFLRLDAVPADAGLAGRCMGALKAGAFLAIAVAIAFIYLDTYVGLRLPRGVTSLAVLAAFFGPSVVVLLLGLRAARRPPEPPADDS